MFLCSLVTIIAEEQPERSVAGQQGRRLTRRVCLVGVACACAVRPLLVPSRCVQKES